MKLITTKEGRVNLDRVALITTDEKGRLMFWNDANVCFMQLADPEEVVRVNGILDRISDLENQCRTR